HLVKIFNNMSLSIQVRKSNQILENYQAHKLHQTFRRSLEDKINLIDHELLIAEAEKQFFPHISTQQITETLILTATSLNERDPIYDELSTKLLLQKLFNEVFKQKINSRDFAKIYRQTFVANLQ